MHILTSTSFESWDSRIWKSTLLNLAFAEILLRKQQLLYSKWHKLELKYAICSCISISYLKMLKKEKKEYWTEPAIYDWVLEVIHDKLLSGESLLIHFSGSYAIWNCSFLHLTICLYLFCINILSRSSVFVGKLFSYYQDAWFCFGSYQFPK